MDQVHRNMMVLREVEELVEIVDAMGTSMSGWERSNLLLMMGGPLDPDEEEVNSKARDAQYELYLKTIVSGTGQVSVGTADLAVSYSGVKLPIEAKRPKSIQRFDDRLREAVAQVDSHGIDGFVAMSLDLILRPKGAHFTSSDVQRGRQMPGALLNNFARRRARTIHQRVTGSRVLATLLTARLHVRIESSGEWLLASGSHLVPTIEPGDARYGAVEAIQSALVR